MGREARAGGWDNVRRECVYAVPFLGSRRANHKYVAEAVRKRDSEMLCFC